MNMRRLLLPKQLLDKNQWALDHIYLSIDLTGFVSSTKTAANKGFIL
ncbi:hypothetical protein C2W64_04272 [Brevibacillus laterosporus]|nr:hypothetical protein C2W64_04272 [Brevibacillus laterosporus]